MDNHKLESIREDLENDLNWRMDEYRFLKNQLAYIEDEDKQKIYRRSLLVMLYSHYEGFCNFSFTVYVLSINELELIRKDAHSHLAAASMLQEFSLFESDEYKEERFKRVFRKGIPNNDRELFKHSKRIYLYDCFEDFTNKPLMIPEKVVNTESNLWPTVLKKMLYSLGLPEGTFTRHETNIKKLVDMRNGISHGQASWKHGLTSQELDQIELSVTDINNTIIRLIYDSMRDKVYLKTVEA